MNNKSLPSDSAYLHARTGDKVCYNGKCYEVNEDEGKIGYSSNIGLTDCESGEKIVLDKSTFANEVKMYMSKCESISISEALKERDWNSDNAYDLYNSYIASNLDITSKKKLAEMLNSDASDKEVLDLIEGVVDGKIGSEYTITYYLNTACSERRPETEDDVENDFCEENFLCVDDFNAMLQAYLVHMEDNGKYNSTDEIMDEYFLDFETVDDVKEYFETCDIGDGSVIICKVEQNTRVVYDSGMDKEYFLGYIDERLQESVQTVNDASRIAEINKKIRQLQDHNHYLSTYAVREVGRGGAYESTAEVDEAIEQNDAEITQLRAELDSLKNK